MKKFKDYINEKHNFIFGGKSGLTGKEYGEEDVKTFNELDVGDSLYSWWFKFGKLEEKSQIKIEGVTYEACTRFIFYGYDTLSSHKTRGKKELPDSVNGKSVYGDARSSLKQWMSSFVIYSTYDMSENEAYYAAKDFFEERLHESNNFIFGGKADLTGKEYGEEDVKTFEDLEKGDTFYLYIVLKRKMAIDEKEKRKVKRVSREQDNKLRLDYISDRFSDWYTLVPEDYENSSRYAQERIPNHLYVFSTIEIEDEEVLDIAKNYYKV